MASLRSLVFTLLMIALVHGIRSHTIKKRRAEMADDLQMENELRRVKRLQEVELSRMKRVHLQNSLTNTDLHRIKRSLRSEPDLSRVKRMRRHHLPVEAFVISTDEHFEPGLNRVKRMKRSPNPMKTKRLSEPSLARMKRKPFFEDEVEIPRMKRNGKANRMRHRKMSKRGHDLKHIKSMNPRLRQVLRDRAKQRRWKKNHRHNKVFQTHRGVSPPMKHRTDPRSGPSKPRSHHHVQHHRRSDEKKPKRISKRM